MDKDRIVGSAKEFAGRAEGAVGDLAGDAQTQASGKAREAAGLTLAQVAAKTGLAEETLCRLESGAVTNPTWQTLGRYAVAVDRDVREVIDRVQDSIEYGFPNRFASRWLPLIRWQAWARLGDVKKVAL